MNNDMASLLTVALCIGFVVGLVVGLILRGVATPDMQADVLEFCERFGHYVGEAPGVPPWDTVKLRHRLVYEETTETLDAIVTEDVEGVADGIVDSIYVLLGTAVSYGIDIAPIWRAVHAANMAKVGGATRADGKILKPEGWQPPNIKQLLTLQGWQG